ncbi:hypothetical protein [Streptomyces sp. NPDC054975]
MDLSDVIDRARVCRELAARLGVVPEGAEEPRLEGRWEAAWSLSEVAWRIYGADRAGELVRAARRAYEECASHDWSHEGYLAFVFRALGPGVYPRDRPVGEEWAGRALEAVRAGLGDKDFGQWIVVLDEALAVVGEAAAVDAMA